LAAKQITKQIGNAKQKEGTGLRALQRVLHAEDDPDIQFLLQLTFETFSDFVYACYNNGEELLEALPAFKPDMVLLDMMMPKMNGLQTLAKLKADPLTQHLPVIFLTAKIQPEEVSHYELQGAFAILFKPFELALLPTKLERLWQRYHSAPPQV
jgi:CheY-like chemotaxis protein